MGGRIIVTKKSIMKLFKCSHCGQLIYFENTFCESCGKPLGFEPDSLQLVTLNAEENGQLAIAGKKTKTRYRYCDNSQHGVCNWLVPAANATRFCKACELNRTIPDISRPEYMERWQTIETAKHRLIYSLLRMRLPLVSKTVDEEKGLAFDFIADDGSGENERVLTGHQNGLITINIAEADDIERETAKKMMNEVYRTVLGHFRHEIAHYYWEVLIAPFPETLEQYRNIFGDDSIDYAEALKAHYENGNPPDWNLNFISAYASTHPWEDWAETWAHYMHIIDTLETAYSFGIKIETTNASKVKAEIKKDPYQAENFDSLINLWLPLTFAMNSLNRSMGLNDLYPFLISPVVKGKMRFIHELILKNNS